MKGPHHADDDTDAIIDDTSGEELVTEETELGEAALKRAVRALRAELAQCSTERTENLAGWQRAKADLANFRRITEEDRARDGARQKGKIVESLLPAIDSFDSAIADVTWHMVDERWRSGMERIRSQLLSALAREGLAAFGEAGEAFDPTQHECVSVSPATSNDTDHTVSQVLQRGYRIDGVVIRPAKVVVAQYADAPPE